MAEVTRQEEILSREQRINELHAEITRLQEQEREERKARMAACKREWKFTVALMKDDHFTKLYDPAVKLYMLTGQVVNVDQCTLAGHSSDYLKGGSMGYLFNTATGRIIMQHGGGTIFISPDSGGGRWEDPEPVKKKRQQEAAADCARVYRELEEFLQISPKGGDVTHIVTSQRHNGWLQQ